MLYRQREAEFGNITFWNTLKVLVTNTLLKTCYCISITVITVVTINMTLKNLPNKFANDMSEL